MCSLECYFGVYSHAAVQVGKWTPQQPSRERINSSLLYVCVRIYMALLEEMGVYTSSNVLVGGGVIFTAHALRIYHISVSLFMWDMGLGTLAL